MLNKKIDFQGESKAIRTGLLIYSTLIFQMLTNVIKSIVFKFLKSKDNFVRLFGYQNIDKTIVKSGVFIVSFMFKLA